MVTKINDKEIEESILKINNTFNKLTKTILNHNKKVEKIIKKISNDIDDLQLDIDSINQMDKEIYRD